MAVAEYEEQLRLAPLAFVAKRVAQARTESGLSHDSIVKRMEELGVETYRQTLINWEKMKYRPKLKLLSTYAEATGKDVGWFLTPEGSSSPFQDAA